MNKKKQIPVILLTGYLGSGKTTVLNGLLKNEKRKIALIVNDMGKINIDASLLKKGMKVEQTQMYELQGGCICCTLREEFINQVEKIASSGEVEAVFVEASGISEPSSIAAGFLYAQQENQILRAYLSSVVTVVDADRIYKEFLSDLKTFTSDKVDENGLDEGSITNLIVDQIEFCNTILLNKCDLLDRNKIEEVKQVVSQIQTKAKIIECTRGEVDCSEILHGEHFDFAKVQASSSIEKALDQSAGKACTDEYGITSFLYENRHPFNREKFMDFLNNRYPSQLIRAKGYIWFSDDDVSVQLFEQAGRNASISEYAVWIAAMEDETAKKDLMENYNDEYFSWDETYGDRMNQIVFIGKNYTEADIIQSLEDCLEQ